MERCAAYSISCKASWTQGKAGGRYSERAVISASGATVRHFILIALAAAATAAWLQDTLAQTGPAAQPQPAGSQPVFTPLTTPWTFPDHDAVNAGTVTIITAPAGGAKSVFAADMARVLDEKDKLRILPVLGKGPVQNVIDVLYLKSIDMGLVATDVPEFYKIQYGSNITERLRYIMKLYNDEISHYRAERDKDRV